eukprot:8887432-Pyramimonas_sp.AAC.1
MAVRVEGFEEIIFADDLAEWKALPAQVSDEEALRQSASCRRSLHEWGWANGARFDPSKEGHRILSRSRPAGDSSKLLGVSFDTELLMRDAIEQCVSSATWRVYSLIRTRRFHSDAELINLLKSHVLSCIEYRSCAISHASSSALAPVDAVLTRFLISLHVRSVEALLYFNLAPHRTRRGIGMLGAIRRSVLGLGPSCFSRFFRLASAPRPSRRFRAHSRH